MITRGVATILVLGSIACSQEPPRPDLAKYESDFAKWESHIAALEKLDAAPDPAGAVLLIGSSSIRLWETAADDLAPYRVIRRGYGGAKFCDLAHFAPRLIKPHRFRAAVVFVANDVTGSSKDKSPEEVGKLFGYVADLLRSCAPNAPIICCDVRPAPSRFHLWDKIQGSNAALRAECEKRPGVHYLDTSEAFLTPDGSAARTDVYGPDRLHLNRAGYDLWSSQIKAEIDRVLAE